MKSYSTVDPLYMSFFSKALYRDVARNWKGISFLYLFLLLGLCWIPVMFRIQSLVNDFLANDAPKLIRQVPPIRISGGIATAEAKMPYFIRNPETGQPIIIIDMTGEITSLDNTDAEALLMKNKFIMKKNRSETRSFSLSDIREMTIDRNSVSNWGEQFRKWFVIFLYPVVLLFSFAYRLIQVLLYALIGKLFARNMKSDLNYQALVSLAIVSLTPVIILNAIYNYLHVKVPFWWLICFILAMGYLRFAVKANTEQA